MIINQLFNFLIFAKTGLNLRVEEIISTAGLVPQNTSWQPGIMAR